MEKTSKSTVDKRAYYFLEIFADFERSSYFYFFARIFLNGTSTELEYLIHHYKYSGSFQFVKRISFDQKSQKSTSISAFMSFTRVLCVY